MSDVAVIDQFLAVFTQYIDSGFGLISGDVAFLVTVLIGVDGTLAGVAWALGEDEVLVQLAKKVLYVGLFAFFLNNWNQLASVVFNSFAALGLKAAGSQLSYADFLQPGRLAHTGVDTANVLLAQIGRWSGFPGIFTNFGEILVLVVAWLVTLFSFFILAILLFLAVIEFKLTTLKGFILVPFALWKGTAFIAEPVLGQVVTSGVRILVFAVVTGIGTQLFSRILPTDPSTEVTLNMALTVLLASMTIGGLALYAPRIASGIVSGAPQLGLGAAAASAGVVAGTVALGAAGAGAAGRLGGAGVRAAASLAGGARAGYALGSMADGGSGARGLLGGLTGAGAAGLAAAAEAVGSPSLGLAESFVAGERAAWRATGGGPIGATGDRTSSAGGEPPGWARRLTQKSGVRAAERSLRGGEGGAAGLKPALRRDDE
jgi:type IV secretion system protein TrbL